MSTTKILLGTAALLVMAAAPAAAVTVKNISEGEITIGIDYGDKEKVETIAAGKSVEFECKELCGVTGPWGFSWKVKGDDTIESDGHSMVTYMDDAKKDE